MKKDKIELIFCKLKTSFQRIEAFTLTVIKLDSELQTFPDILNTAHFIQWKNLSSRDHVLGKYKLKMNHDYVISIIVSIPRTPVL